MENRFAEELYSESLQLSKLELTPSADDQQNNLNVILLWKALEKKGVRIAYIQAIKDMYDRVTTCVRTQNGTTKDFPITIGLHQDGSVWDDSNDDLDEALDLDREWQRRHDQFHNIGYRDGLIAGKEASAQEGFNIGFKQSVFAGYNWGLVRGITSAFAHLPDELKEKLVETQEKRNEFQGLYESVHSLSTTDALKLFNEDIKAKEASEQIEHVEVSQQIADLQAQTSDCSLLGNYLGQLKSLIRESPAIDMRLPEPR